MTSAPWALAAPAAAPAGGGTLLQLCRTDGDARPAAGDVRESYARADGSRLNLMVRPGDAPAESPGCDQLHLPVPPDEVRWAALLSPEQAARIGDRVALQGLPQGARFEVSEIITDQDTDDAPVAASAAAPLRAGAWRVFGSEARVAWDGTRLSCRAGQALAGAVWQPPEGWSGAQPRAVTLWARGAGEWTVAAADADRLAREAPHELGRMALTDALNAFTWALPAQDAPWRALTFVCPHGPGELVLDTAVARAVAPIRSAWLWSPGLWLDQPDTVWQLQRAHGLNALYVTVPVAKGAVQHAEALAAFVAQARTRGLAIWAVIGDPGDVLSAQHPALLERLRAYASYNLGASADQKLAGVQMDIEPYLLPGYRLEPAKWRTLYVDTVAKARQALDAAMPLDLVVPVWWGTHRDWGRAWLQALAPLEVSLTVMNYRTQRNALVAGAAPFLRWGDAAQRSVTMALEYGPLPDEQRHHFERARTGSLLKLRLGTHDALVLLASPLESQAGTVYTNKQMITISGKSNTFAGNISALRSTAHQLMRLWSPSQRFSGIAFHGLDPLIPVSDAPHKEVEGRTRE